MIFMEWWIVERVSVVVAVIAAAVGLFITARRRRAWIRYTLQGVALLIALGVAAVSLLVVSLPDANHYSDPLYSPNHKLAARIAEYDAGPLGGADTSVEVFSHAGFVSHRVYIGEFKTVGVGDLTWNGDSELRITYYGAAYRCSGTKSIRVICVQKSLTDR